MLIKTFTGIFLIVYVCTSAFAQQANQQERSYEDTGKHIASQISAIHLESYLNVISSDEFEGRETGSPGNEKAAKYITQQFKKFGIPTPGESNSYYQNVSFTWVSWDEISMTVNGESFKHLWDFMAFQDQNNSLKHLKASEVVFMGYGIDTKKYSDYAGKKVKDKVILIYKGEPVSEEGIYHITGTDAPSVWKNNTLLKAQTAYRHGAKLVLVIEDEFRTTLAENRRSLFGAKVLLGSPEENKVEHLSNMCLISTNLAKAIIGDHFDRIVASRNKSNQVGKPGSFAFKCMLEAKMIKETSALDGYNLLGYIEGSDPELKDELVVLSAHYDHLGKRGDDVFNGADDNGSGTVTVMEIARVLMEAKLSGKGPARSVLALLVTGEEKGLLGSKYYVNHPVFPLENTIANVNIDMVGRIDDIYIDDPNYIYVIGADKLSTDLHKINEEVNNKHVGLKLDYKYNDENDPNRFYYRSDHYNFAKNGIPAVFYFNGTHEDYHRPTDTIDKIHFPKMEKIAKLAFWVVWELANRNERITVDVIN